MLSISTPAKNAQAAAKYYLPPGREAYYVNGIDQPGRWFGQGAQELGLGGRAVTAETLQHLLQGFSPDGERPLVQNAGDPHRDAYWDLTFNAPKSVSVLWALAPAEVRRQIEAAHDRAVATTLAQAEGEVGITRRGPGGKVHEHAGLLFATFRQGISRAQDPHLHTHAVLVNLAVRRDGTTGAIHTPYLFAAKMSLGAAYQVTLARELETRLGLQVEHDRVSFRLPEVPKDLCRELSKRGQAIQQRLEARGESGAVAAKVAALDTRPRKVHLPAGQLFDQWRQTAQQHGWSQTQAASLVRSPQARTCSREVLAKRFHDERVLRPEERRTRRHLVRLATRVALQLGAGPEELRRVLAGVKGTEPLQSTSHASAQGPGTPPTSARFTETQSEVQATRSERSVASGQDRPVEQAGSREADARPAAGQEQATSASATLGSDHTAEQRSSREPAVRAIAGREPPAPARTSSDSEQDSPARTPRHSKRSSPAQQANPRTSALDQPGTTSDHPQTQSTRSSGTDQGSAQSHASPGAAPSPASPQPNQDLEQRPESQPRQEESGKQRASKKQKKAKRQAPFQWTRRLLADLDPRLAGTAWKQKALSFRWRAFFYAQHFTTPIPKDLAGRSPKQDRRNRQFAQAFARELDRTADQKPRTNDLIQRAVSLAAKHLADTRGLQEVLHDLSRRGRLPVRKAFIRIEWRPLFPKAPSWSPAKRLTAPVIVVGHRDPKWWSIRWKKRLLIGELRVQDRLLFRNAPEWSPLYGRTLPALRSTLQRSEWEPRPRASKQNQTNSKTQSQSQSQSQSP